VGDQVGTSVSGSLYYIPKNEFDRVLDANISDIEKVELFSSMCRVNTLYMIAKCGSGHIGSSFSSMEIMSLMHLYHLKGEGLDVERRDKDIFFSSKGHDAPGLYSVMIGTGKLEFSLIHELRRLGGLPGHPDVGTPNMVTNTGSLGMGISKAKGMIFANRLLNKKANIYVLTGDGEIQEGQFWESLISAANNALSELTVIIDHNKLQSDTLVSKVSDLGDLEAKLSSFGWHVDRCNGNSVKELKEALSHVSSITDKPKVLIADTIKGKGVSFMEHTAIDSDVELYKYHSGAPSGDAYARASQELIDNLNLNLRGNNLSEIELDSVDQPATKLVEKTQKLVPAYTEGLLRHAEKNPNIVALDADLVLDTGLIPFAERYPKRFIECGIAEQDMVSQAGGMALNGLLPIVHSFACFLTARPAEQIYNNATEHSKIIYVGTLAGVIPGGPGHSHQGVRDISSMGAIPGITVVEPSCEEEVKALLDWVIHENTGSSYIRLMSLPVATNFSLPGDYQPERGKGVQIISGEDALVFAYGPQMLTNAVAAAKELDESLGIKVGVINMPWLNTVDSEWLQRVLKSTAMVFCIDNHYRVGALSDRLAATIMSIESLSVKLISIGLDEVPACGTNDEIMSFHRLDRQSIAEQIKLAFSRADEV